jgi:hypothetical protein
MSRQALLVAAVKTLEFALHSLLPRVERAQLVDVLGGQSYRHRHQHDLLACYLKAIRIVSTLNACLVLLRQGYVQEVYVLCRCVDEYGEDISFMSFALGKDSRPSPDQVRFLEEYFQEEFTDADDIVGSQKSRDRVSRRRIHAALARLHSQDNPYSSQQVQSVVHKTFSGFVHAAYVHTMDLYDGSEYHTQGMPGTPRIAECEEVLPSYIYRAAIAITLVAKRLGAEDAVEALRRFAGHFGNETNCLPPRK